MQAKRVALKIRPVPIEIDRELSHPRWDRGTSRIADSIFQDVDQADKDRLVELTVAQPRVGDRALGALVGLAVGDWMGAPLEFLDAVQTPKSTNQFWDTNAFAYVGELPENRERDALELGQFTDGTLSRRLASLVRQVRRQRRAKAVLELARGGHEQLLPQRHGESEAALVWPGLQHLSWTQPVDSRATRSTLLRRRRQ